MLSCGEDPGHRSAMTPIVQQPCVCNTHLQLWAPSVSQCTSCAAMGLAAPIQPQSQQLLCPSSAPPPPASCSSSDQPVMLGRNLLCVSLHAAGPAARQVSRSALRPQRVQLCPFAGFWVVQARSPVPLLLQAGQGGPHGG